MYIVEKKYIFPNKQSLQDEQLRKRNLFYFSIVKFKLIHFVVPLAKKKKEKIFFPKESC